MTDYFFSSLFIITKSRHSRCSEYLRAGRSKVRIQAGAKDFSLFRNTHTVSRTYPAPCSMVVEVPSPVWHGRTVKLTTFLHLAPRIRMSGAIYLLHPYAFVAWSGPVLSFSLFLGALAIFRKRKTINFVCPSVRTEPLSSHWTDFHEVLMFLENPSRKFKFH
jgi:hypothetical protein